MSIINSQPRIGAAGQSTGFRIERSLRFNSADTANLNRTFSSSGNRKTWTWSGWVKRALIESEGTLFSGSPNASNYSSFSIGRSSGNRYLRFFNVSTTLNLDVITSSVYRDASAWYHIVLAVDTTQATDSNRVKIYVNGVQVTAFGTATYPSQNTDLVINQNCSHTIGKDADVAGGYLDAYITECYFIDGSTPTTTTRTVGGVTETVLTQFGEFDTDTGVWKPKAYSGSYGTNGFYLKFADNSGTTSTTLGKDSSGNGNNWTPNNFSVTAGAGNDSLVDTPTPYGTDTGAGGEVRGNYCTLNPLDIYSSTSAPTFANGNLDASSSSVAFYRRAYGTFALFDNCYWEFTVGSGTLTNNAFGIASKTEDPYNVSGYYATEYAYRNTGAFVNNNSTIATYGSFSAGDIVRFAYSAGKLFVAINGTWQNSGNPAAGTGALVTGLTGSWKLFVAFDSTGVTHSLNAGQRPFAYTAPSGHKALCTQNLPTPTIGATATTRADDYFNTVLWSGTGGARTISGLGFQPDWVWAKGRSGSATYPHLVWDVLRGTNLNLVPNTTDAEFNAATSSSNGGLGTSASDGFTIVAGSSSADNLNASSPASTYVGWAWKANGAGSSNTAGTITSTVSANTTAGFSIVTYTGNGTVGATVGHGLGVTPAMLIVKRRDATSANRWAVQHTSLAADQLLALNTTAAVSTESAGAGSTFNVTKAGSSVFTLGNYADSNANTGTYVAYVFAPVAGYSAFGSFTGNGSADGPFIYLGFRPKYWFWKRTDSVSDWDIQGYDTSYNPALPIIFLNKSDAEYTGSPSYPIDLLSNGVKIRSVNQNANGGTYIYAAFAENPFKYSLAR